MSEETHNTAVTQPQTTQPTEQATAPVKKPESVKPQTAQPTSTVKAPDTVKPQPTGNTVSTVSAPTKTTEPAKPQSTAPTAPATVREQEPVVSQHTQPTVQVANPKQQTTAVPSQEAIKPQTVQPTEMVKAPEPTTPVKTPEPVKVSESVTSQPTQPTEVPKLSDVIPTSKVWISGLIGNRQIDCLGPIEIPLKIDRPTYPFTPVASNPNYTNQVFDYDTSTWIATDAKSQGQQLTDLTKVVTDLQQASIKHDNTAEQAQQMSMKQMQMLMTIDAKLEALTKKEGIK